jgi:DNA-binding NtrC family response regulator/tetratricopeptide (TPR) repeat protein
MPENPGGNQEYEYSKRPPKHQYKPLTSEEELGDMHFSTENFSVALEYYEKAISRQQTASEQPSDLGRLYYKISNCYFKKGLLQEAMTFLQSAESLCDDKDEIGNAMISCRRGFILLEHGAFEKALRHALNAYGVLRLTDMHKEVADTQVLMAVCYTRLGKNSEAEQCFLDALSSFRRINDPVGEANLLNNLGLFHKNACRWGRALDYLERALKICEEIGLSHVKIHVTLNLGIVYLKKREFTEAVSSFSAARKMARQTGDDLKYTRSTLMLGVAETRTGSPTAAEKHLLEARVLSEQRSYRREIALADEFLGDLMLDRGNLEGALENYSVALEAGKKLSPNGDIVAEVLRRLAYLYVLQNQPEQAIRTAQQAIEIARECGEVHEIGYAERTIGLALAMQRRHSEAEEHIKTSATTFLKVNNPYEARRSSFVLGEYLERKSGRTALVRAKKLIEEAMAFFEQEEIYADLAEGHIVLAKIQRSLGHKDDCLLHIYEAQRLADDMKDRSLLRRIRRMRRTLEDEVTGALAGGSGDFKLSEELTGLFSKEPRMRSYLETVLGDLMRKMSAGYGFVTLCGGNGRRKVQMLASSGVNESAAVKLTTWFVNRSDVDTKAGLLFTDAEHDVRLADVREMLPGRYAPVYFHPICLRGEPFCLLFFQCKNGSGEPPKLGSDIDVAATYAGFIGFLVKGFLESKESNEGKAASMRRGPLSIITRNERMLRLINLAERVAASRSTVLLMGETGTGKGLIAETIHQLSPRRKNKFVHVNCAALPENIIESELFGHVKGSFTGAISNKKGLLEEANGGTIFLDEIGKTPLPLQGKLLQFLDTKKIRPVGGNEMVEIDVRLIFASKVDLLTLCREGKMLEDFYYRINDFPLTIPPLRERKEDIELLAHHYFDLINEEIGKNVAGISNDAMERLETYRWSGNVRELEKIIKRAIILADENTLVTPDLLAFDMDSAQSEQVPSSSSRSSLSDMVRDLEKRAIRETLSRCSWNRSAAAREIGISYPTLLKKIREYGIGKSQ